MNILCVVEEQSSQIYITSFSHLFILFLSFLLTSRRVFYITFGRIFLSLNKIPQNNYHASYIMYNFLFEFRETSMCRDLITIFRLNFSLFSE